MWSKIGSRFEGSQIVTFRRPTGASPCSHTKNRSAPSASSTPVFFHCSFGKLYSAMVAGAAVSFPDFNRLLSLMIHELFYTLNRKGMNCDRAARRRIFNHFVSGLVNSGIHGTIQHIRQVMPVTGSPLRSTHCVHLHIREVQAAGFRIR